MAYQVTVFETAAELFNAFADGTISSKLYLVHENGGPPYLSGTESHDADTSAKNASRFSLELLDWDDILTEALDRVGIDVHFT